MLKWLCTLLTVLFVGLKVTGHLSWGWVAVLSPAIGFLAFLFFLVLAAGVVAAKGR